jgi:SulP family sulfate permease
VTRKKYTADDKIRIVLEGLRGESGIRELCRREGIASGSTEQMLPTVLLLIIGSTVLMGLVFLAMGAFRLGGLVRFLPYPVLGGFLAGTGWLLTVGGIGVTTGVPLGVGQLQPASLAHWLPAVVLGLLTLLAVNRWKSPVALVAVFALAGLAFYSVTGLLGISLLTLTRDGWLVGPLPPGLRWQFPLAGATLARVNWPALFSAAPVAAPALLISLVALLLNASSLELVVKRDIALNQELMAAGAANILAGLGGGLIGYHAISVSTLDHALTRGKRLPGLLTALLLALTVFGGSLLLAYVPLLLLGGMLVYIGLALLNEWVLQAVSTFPKIDYAIVLAILVTIALKGFMWGIGLGLVLTVILFIINYSRVSIIQYELSGSTYHSRVNRSPIQSELLQRHGDQLLIFKLQGFIFFGTANQLFEHVRERVRQAAPAPVRFILLDFERVSGLDSTGRHSFSKMLQFARESQAHLILTGLTDRLRDQLLPGGLRAPQDGLHLLADIDRGIEWGEDQIIAGLQTASAAEASLTDELVAIWPDRAQIDALLRYMQRAEVAPGEHLIHQGDEPDQLFFVEVGQVTAQLEKPGAAPVRLETMQGGRVVGELGFFLGTRRSASVVADRPSVVYCLTREAWDQILANDPEVAQTLNGLMIHLLGQRVLHLTRVVNALQR